MQSGLPNASAAGVPAAAARQDTHEAAGGAARGVGAATGAAIVADGSLTLQQNLEKMRKI